MMVPKKYICIHGHFYQPPRENAWLEHIELQDSAAPFHDWNERINFECYAPNATARRIDPSGKIVDIVNNYKYLSFNFGPTLLSWMEKADKETYQAIIDADKESRKIYKGHGSAIAQVYNHLIMPLANQRDKITQVRWGIEDFEYRFGRKPTGMWLAETACDTETLEILAEQDIVYTILAPNQAAAFRKIGTETWQTTAEKEIDTRRPYLIRLPSGRHMALFFYNGQVAQGVAFEGLLNDGHLLADRLLNTFDDSAETQLVHIATDGESYGHHHNKGEMALAACFHKLLQTPDIELTNYAAFLALHPPSYEVQIHENSSWSCAHGVERWRSNCGCRAGGNEWWTQEWRGPLRNLLNDLRDSMIPIFESEASSYLKDPWKARDEYIAIINNRTVANIDQFIERHALRSLEEAGRTKVLRLMEMQRNALLMFTSCGWFFDEVSGLETNQILQYANRAITFTEQTSGIDLHPSFFDALVQTPSNVFKNAAESYQLNVLPSKVDLLRVGMHFAAASIFEEHPEKLDLFNYKAVSDAFTKRKAGNQILSIGRIGMQSKITLSHRTFSFAVLYLGQQNLIGNISANMSEEVYQAMEQALSDSFDSINLGEVIGLMQLYFGTRKYSIKNLFQDEKRKILDRITQLSFEKALQSFKDIYNDNYQLMSGMLNANIPIPAAYKSVLSFVLNQDLIALLEHDSFSISQLEQTLNEMKKWEVSIENEPEVQLNLSDRLFSEIKKLNFEDENSPKAKELCLLLELFNQAGFHIDLWKSQNLYFKKAAKVSNKSEDIFQLGNLLNIQL